MEGLPASCYTLPLPLPFLTTFIKEFYDDDDDERRLA